MSGRAYAMSGTEIELCARAVSGTGEIAGGLAHARSGTDIGSRASRYAKSGTEIGRLASRRQECQPVLPVLRAGSAAQSAYARAMRCPVPDTAYDDNCQHLNLCNRAFGGAGSECESEGVDRSEGYEGHAAGSTA
eukprot:2541710-Rhodomonas_salina.1